MLGLDALLAWAKEHPPTEEDLRAQARSWAIGEAALGSDADETAYRLAYRSGDKTEIDRLDTEAKKRHKQASARLR